MLSEKWANLRGVEIVSFGVNSVKASEEDEAMIKELQKNAVFRNANMAAAHLVGAARPCRTRPKIRAARSPASWG